MQVQKKVNFMKHLLIPFFIGCLITRQCYAQFAVMPPVIGEKSHFDSASKHTLLSDVQLTGMTSDNSISLFPNPATDFVWLQAAPVNNTVLRVTFFDINGRKLFEQAYSLEEGRQNIKLILPGYDLGSTIYVRVEMPDHSTPKMTRILRQI
jgi:hypothetical protein